MKYFSLMVAGLILCSCSDSKSTGSATQVGAAVSGLFSQSGESATARSVENDTCGEFTGQEGAGEGGPEGVVNSGEVTPGTYGVTSDSVTLEADDDCDTSPDSSDSFASFTLTQDVVGDCTSGASVTMKTGSTGVFRNTATHTPEIYGTFSFTTGGTTFEGIKCTIRMTDGGVLDSDVSSCVDSDGAAISMTSSDSCSFN